MNTRQVGPLQGVLIQIFYVNYILINIAIGRPWDNKGGGGMYLLHDDYQHKLHQKPFFQMCKLENVTDK